MQSELDTFSAIWEDPWRDNQPSSLFNPASDPLHQHPPAHRPLRQHGSRQSIDPETDTLPSGEISELDTERDARPRIPTSTPIRSRTRTHKSAGTSPAPPSPSSSSSTHWSLHQPGAKLSLIRAVPHLDPEQKLTTSNYQAWVMMIKTRLELIELFEYCLGTVPKPLPSSPTFQLWNRANNIVRTILITNMSSELIIQVGHLPDASSIWYETRRICAGQSAMDFTLTISQLMTMTYLPEDDVGKHIAKMRQLNHALTLMGRHIPDDIFAVFLRLSMPTSWRYIFGGLPETYTSAEIERRIRDEYAYQLIEQTRASSKALAVTQPRTPETPHTDRRKHRHSTRYCTTCRKHGHTLAKCWAKGGGSEGQRPRRKKTRSRSSHSSSSSGSSTDSSSDSSNSNKSSSSPEVVNIVYADPPSLSSTRTFDQGQSTKQQMHISSSIPASREGVPTTSSTLSVDPPHTHFSTHSLSSPDSQDPHHQVRVSSNRRHKNSPTPIIDVSTSPTVDTAYSLPPNHSRCTANIKNHRSRTVSASEPHQHHPRVNDPHVLIPHCSRTHHCSNQYSTRSRNSCTKPDSAPSPDHSVHSPPVHRVDSDLPSPARLPKRRQRNPNPKLAT
ncbi:hypothetical protein NLI96_g1117 [Meripilus lineatus]|uniref:Uncharacterized protein n=1 Tax=Meripilus lineatus TaxID=2056292 RepID=A0AAD5YN45_9APHY|nr:hypothetical protein NLI96_g1117 [Physisporinus lineatus]